MKYKMKFSFRELDIVNLSIAKIEKSKNMFHIIPITYYDL